MTDLKRDYTKTPNAIYRALPDMHEAEIKVSMVVVRETAGWRKDKARISLSDFQEDTGMSRQGVINGIEVMLNRGLIGREPAQNGGFFYYIVVNEVDQQAAEVVNEVDQTSQQSRPQLVNRVDPNNKDNKDIERKTAQSRRRKQQASRSDRPLSPGSESGSPETGSDMATRSNGKHDGRDYLDDLGAFLRQPTPATEIADLVGELTGIPPPQEYGYEADWGKPSQAMWAEAQEAGLTLEQAKVVLRRIANADDGWLKHNAKSAKGFYKSFRAAIREEGQRVNQRGGVTVEV